MIDKRFERLDQCTIQTILLDEIAGRLRDQAPIRSNLPLYQTGVVISSLKTKWTTFFELKIDADEEVFPSYLTVIFEAGNNQEIRILSNNKVLNAYMAYEGAIILMWFNNELRFTIADEHPLVLQFRTDGVVGHEFSGEVQCTGIRRKLKEAKK